MSTAVFRRKAKTKLQKILKKEHGAQKTKAKIGDVPELTQNKESQVRQDGEQEELVRELKETKHV